jgi:HSP20 family protein
MEISRRMNKIFFSPYFLHSYHVEFMIQKQKGVIMDFTKLVPWNWFKEEEEKSGGVVPVKKGENVFGLAASFQNIESEFNHLLESLRHSFGGGSSNDLLFKNEWLKPSLDIASDEKEYSVKIELPGIDKNNISIEYANNTLKIKGEKHHEEEEQNKDFYRIERSYGRFERILDLPEDSDADNITSQYKNGVLSISIPRKMLPKADTKKIEIKTAS